MANWYYYDNNGQKQGPVTSGELKQLAEQRIITPETKVENSEGHIAFAKNVKGLMSPVRQPQAVPPISNPGIPPVYATALPSPSPSPFVPPIKESFSYAEAGESKSSNAYGNSAASSGYGQPVPSDTNIDTLITALIASVLRSFSFLENNKNAFIAYQRNMSLCLTWLVLAGFSVSSVLFGIIMSVQNDSLRPLLEAVGFGLTGIMLHFLCSRFAFSGMALVESTPCRVATDTLTECMGLFALLTAPIAFGGGMYAGINTKDITFVIGGFVTLVFFGSLAVYCLNPNTCLNTYSNAENKTSTGETALSIYIVSLRLLLISIPTIGTLLAFSGTYLSVWTTIKLILKGHTTDFVVYIAILQQNRNAVEMLFIAGVLPFLMYLYYLLSVLSIDICRAIFDIARNTQKTEKLEP